jgi:prepilin-type N-terminal cleavage/methylation domain-containing protein
MIFQRVQNGFHSLFDEERRKMRAQHGFTLLELLTVIATIGILSAIALSGMKVYRSNAAYSVAQKTIHDARTSLEAGVTAETPPGAVPAFSQNTQGAIGDAAASTLMPGMQVPKNVKLQATYDPTCNDGSCFSEMLQVDHCLSENFVRWTRLGNGVEFEFPNQAGGNCN